MYVRQVEIQNLKGLHARATSAFVKTADAFQCDIRVQKMGDDAVVSGKSIMGLLMLGVSLGQQIEITAQGADEKEAVEALVSLVNNRFGEES